MNACLSSTPPTTLGLEDPQAALQRPEGVVELTDAVSLNDPFELAAPEAAKSACCGSCG